MTTRPSADLRRQVIARADNGCEYCLVPQELAASTHQVDHVIAEKHGGQTVLENLALSCTMCNLFKGQQTHGRDPLTRRRVRLYHPRRQPWRRHFQWSPDGTMIVGRTATGRATVVALHLNNLVAVTVRRNWVTAGWHPPRD